MIRRALAGACLALMVVGCGRSPELETRTFPVHNLESADVERLVGPYVYSDRAENPGSMSASDGALTVRETPDNLDKIARVLKEYDVPRSDVRLRFQLIEADGFTDKDPAIADVETELRKLFQFRGYRLAGEALVQATHSTNVQQTLSGEGGHYSVTATVYWAGPETIRLDGVRLFLNGRQPVLQTSVNVRPGQTLVLGTSPKQGSTATLLLTVRAEETEK